MGNKLRIIVYTILGITYLSCSQVLHAQINLEHTYEGSASYHGAGFINVSAGVNLYILQSNDGNQVKLYNEDHSLYKTVTITPPAGYKIVGLSLVSKKLFNANDNIEFIIIFRRSTADDNNDNMRLYDDGGNMIKDFGNAYSFNPSCIKISNGQFKLVVFRYMIENSATLYYSTDIYSLPGSVPVVAIREGSSIESPSPYPNPSNSIVHLPYQLKNGETSVMHIYNLQGQLLEQKQIDYAFHEILLDVSMYVKGVYIYEVNGISNKFIVE
jgi:hypothetical protein